MCVRSTSQALGAKNFLYTVFILVPATKANYQTHQVHVQTID
jgi:hypothetical protein